MSGNIENILGFPYRAVEPKSPESQLRDCMAQFEMDPGEVILDGKIHRFGAKKSSWYVAYGDGVPAGIFGNWKTGEHIPWRADVGRELTVAEQMAHTRHVAELRAIRDKELQDKHKVAATTVLQIWEQAGLASDEHPYLKRKDIKAHGLRITGDGRLIAPLYDKDGELSSLQYITSEGSKQFHPGSAAQTSFTVLGDIGQDCFVAEGFATGATIHEVTGRPVVIAYTAGSLLETTRMLREQHPALSITIIADLDASGVGQAKAEQAASKYGARVVVSPVSSDVNDYVQGGGDLLSLLDPPKEKPWLTPVSEFCKQPAPIRWLVKHWIQDMAMIMVHGPSGSGKTFVVLDWCMRISSQQEAQQEEWCGELVKPGSVVYLAGEGHQGLRGRVAAWMQYHHQSDIDMVISRSGTDLNTPEGLQKTITAIRDLPETPRLIVVDTLHRFLQGDENSAQDTKTMLDACSLLMREFNCSVLLVHHTGVNQEAQHRGRGSSAWKGALDIEISVQKKEHDSLISIIQRKNKDAELAQDKHLDLTTVPISGWLDEDGEQVTSAVLVEGDTPISVDAQRGKDRTAFAEAWKKAGSETMQELPYLSRSAWREYLKEAGMKSYEQAVKPTAGGLANRLINGTQIAKHDSGFLAVDGALITLCRLGTFGT